MGAEELESVLEHGRLLNDLPWSMPIHLPVPDAKAAPGVQELRAGDEVALVDGDGRPVALLRIEESFRFDRPSMARRAYGTEDPAHPNVADILAQGERAWGGRLELLRRLDTVG